MPLTEPNAQPMCRPPHPTPCLQVAFFFFIALFFSPLLATVPPCEPGREHGLVWMDWGGGQCSHAGLLGLACVFPA